ncbi:hypothetical protein [Stygiobacter electus]|jgi:uncharacterized CHY-type Zn-finger protein|uniref:Uncharacterized protein n=1 Tax=Stygiobacter electus TaxID=3032292 RepID=A0AAE3P1P5_9BACT|nr:hypothetical protein [Stygiobacter electus]MDF1612620.1 hypothetical protein [Stygiobacter electus]
MEELICPWCYHYLVYTDLEEKIKCPHCRRKINQWDIIEMEE